MSHSGIFILMLWSLMACASGFTMDRSALAPFAWDTAPSLDAYHRVHVFVDPALKDKMQMTGVDKTLPSLVENAKMPENQTNEKRSTTETEMKLIEIKPINEMTSALRNIFHSFHSEENADTTPRNIILLLIDERSQDEEREENSWKNFKEKLPFAIEGFLQSCHDKFENGNFSMDNASVSEKKENDNCECVLRSNIGELLSWVRQVRGMTTDAVSGSNFSIPFFPRYESSRFNENNAKLVSCKSKRDSNDDWQMIDFSDHARSVSPLSDPKTGQHETGEMNYDVTWDFFDVLSKIRMALFHSLIELLHRNDGGFKDDFLSRKSFSFKSSTANLIENTIRELKSVSNNKGYMLIAAAPKSEAAAVIDLLQHEAPPEDTLLIVTQICVEDQRLVPFIARGPNCRILREARNIDELSITIKKAMITRDCHDTGCTNRQRRDVPAVSRMSAGEVFSQELPARKRVIRSKNAGKPSIVNAEVTTIEKEIQARSSTSLKIPCGFGTVLGITTSILAQAVMTSF